MAEVRVRKAERGDMGRLLTLMQESAPVLHEEVHPSITEQVLETSSWDRPVFQAFLAEEVDKSGSVMDTVGYALSHNLYSTWEGISSALRHIYVAPTHRRRGIASRLWRAVVKESLEKDCIRCDCYIPKHNTDAIAFCLKDGRMMDITQKEGWRLFRMDEGKMKTFIQSVKHDISRARIRPAKREDFTAVLKLIQDLADYEEMPEGPIIDAKKLAYHALDQDSPVFECWVAEDIDKCGKNDNTSSGTLVGYTIFIPILSCEGRAVYMEDLYVSPSQRNCGIGQALWATAIQTGLRDGAVRCEWETLDSNHSGIRFYKSKGSINMTEERGIHHFRMFHDQMRKFVQKS
ncbi:hypothetical protein Pmani_009889 [Petrolisthes manimaculis]|uniref:N-acetyltransferase domain-containing protein n=1 Tax=Petrolisthes manimaculis TaxID=1843537 RepID=A0AAE1UHA6_9EUCA|nr:hypothetical protein Pmani_009889 [Petrolisthes manimaculis]